MQELASFAGLVATLAIGTVSPGPSFVMVARTSMSRSREEGLAAALGMGLGGLAFAGAALAGLQAVLLAVPSVYAALRGLGGLYLAWLGIRIWRGARAPLAFDASAGSSAVASGTGRAFAVGLSTQLSNPKTAIVYASVFAAFLPADPSIAFRLALLAAAAVIESGWYAFVAWSLSSAGPRQAYLRFKTVLDRIAGGVMIGLGLRLVWSARAA
jgi:threonine/homoserine/homoserine lactone efflux protein